MEVSRQGYYAWLKRKPSARTKKDKELGVKIKAIHQSSKGTYGRPRIHKELDKTYGDQVSPKRVARIMSELEINGKTPRCRRKTTDSNHNLPIAENLINRDFSVEAPNMLWASDISYVRTWDGWLYLAVVLDLYSRRVVGWAIKDHMRTSLVTEALEMAINQSPGCKGLIHHSDRGSQYASNDYQKLLKKHGIICSMSRKGDCFDNAMAESFFSTIKKDLIYRYSWPTKLETRKAVVEYISFFYNSKRMHSSIENMSPMEYEKLYEQKKLK